MCCDVSLLFPVDSFAAPQYLVSTVKIGLFIPTEGFPANHASLVEAFHVVGGSWSFLGIGYFDVRNCFNNLLASAQNARLSCAWKSTPARVTAENTVDATDTLGCSVKLSYI